MLNRRSHFFVGQACWLSIVWMCCTSQCQERSSEEIAVTLEQSLLDRGIQGGMSVLERGVANYPNHRSCFSCHHQALPLLAFSIGQPTKDHSLTRSIRDFTQEAFSHRTQTLREGGEIGGKTLTVGYALWTMDLAGEPVTETTSAMVEYLLKTQSEDGAWNFHSLRPPAASSRAMTTAIALYGLRAYGPEVASAEQLELSLTRAQRWLRTLEGTESHEDLIGQIWLSDLLTKSLPEKMLDRSPEVNEQQISRLNQLWESQQSDGGWAQTEKLDSDAYATGQAVLLLAQLDQHLKHAENRPRIDRAIRFLIDAQQPDGSWMVTSRSKPVQVYFDNGDPHGKNQFISMMATAWATAALREYRYGTGQPLESLRALARAKSDDIELRQKNPEATPGE